MKRTIFEEEHVMFRHSFRRFVERLFADNPLGQSREQTPICLVREVSWPAGTELLSEPRRRLTPP